MKSRILCCDNLNKGIVWHWNVIGMVNELRRHLVTRTSLYSDYCMAATVEIFSYRMSIALE
jgi:hypothetical protein